MFGINEIERKNPYPEEPAGELKTGDPEGKRIKKHQFFKWLFFLFFVIYLLISYYHAPILTRMGRYLILEHPAEKSDLIVCLSGGNIERGLATADAYRRGLAPKIFIAREELPDGYELLVEKGIRYPETIDLMLSLLKDLGVPESAIIRNDTQVGSTIAEAQLVKKIMEQKGYKSLIIITSPYHSRRAWLTYRKVFEGSAVRILALPSKYSLFKPEDWWKKRRYVKKVVVEYQKLIFYTLRYFF